MKESKGYITSVSSDGKAQVVVETDNSAGRCSSPQGHCHCAGKPLGFAVKVDNRAGAKVGDYVSLLFKPGAILKSVLVLIGIPSFGILAGVVVGTAMNGTSLISPNQAFVAGAACFVLAVVGAVLVYRGIAKDLQPYVSGIIASGVGAGVPVGFDPVCGREVDPLNAAVKIDYEGKSYYFCRAGCLNAFVKEPGRYLGGFRCARN